MTSSLNVGKSLTPRRVGRKTSKTTLEFF